MSDTADRKRRATLGEETLDHRIAADLFRQLPFLALIIVATTLLFWVVMRPQAIASIMDIWMVAMLVTMAVRLTIWVAHQFRWLDRSDGEWVSIHALACLAQGCSWAIVFFTVPDWDELGVVAPAWMLMFGVLSACCASLWQHFPTFLAYTLPIAITGGTTLIAFGSDDIRWLTVALLIYYVMIAVFTKITNGLYRGSVTLELSNRRLVQRLERQTREQEAIIDQRTADLVEQQASLEHMANHDPLTGLSNRLVLVETLERMIESGGANFGLLFIDLDHFKEINDSLGHGAGDDVLSTVAERLRKTVRQGDEVSRLGGDEFTVLLPGLTNVEAATTLSKKILEVLAVPIELPEQRLVITASIGVCIYPDDGENAADILRNADSAMYRAKRTGRNTFSRYEPEMTERALTRVSLESDLRQALVDGDLSVAFQPQVDMRNGQLLGAEALLRWKHASRGYISPEEFIPIAEETGIIRDLGYWVLDQVCATAKALEASGCHGLTFAVNVSARQLLDDGFPAKVAALVEAAGCRDSSLELEITESVLIQNPARARKILDELCATGITFAVDDFGTGYSSLAYLKQYPISKLKIDASFVRDLADDASDRAIADAVIALAKSLSLKVIAEGVETEAQRDMLLADGCFLAQGFLFYEPLPADDFISIANRAAA